MQYALMIYNEAGYEQNVTGEQRAAVHADYLALTQDPRAVGGARLHAADMATSVRVVDGRRLVTDGPFADTKEVLGGFYLIEAADLDEAIDFAARIPAARLNGVVEVRPVAP